MMTPEMLKDLLESKIPQSTVRVTDLTGTFDHYMVDVSSPAFAGKSLLEQHKLVHAAVGNKLQAFGGPDAPIHALQIKTRTP